MITISSPYFHVQAIRRFYRDRGIFTTAKPFTYVINPFFPTEGAAGINQVARAVLRVDSDSDFVWVNTQWYAQDVRFNPPQSVSATGEISTWEIVRAALFRFNFRVLDNQRAFHQDPFIDFLVFGGWSGVTNFNIGLAQDDINRTLVTPNAAAADIGIGCFQHPFTEPLIVPEGGRVEVSIQARANNAASDHLIAFHGVKLFRHH